MHPPGLQAAARQRVSEIGLPLPHDRVLVVWQGSLLSPEESSTRSSANRFAGTRRTDRALRRLTDSPPVMSPVVVGREHYNCAVKVSNPAGVPRLVDRRTTGRGWYR